MEKLWLLPYNPLWLSKSEMIGIKPIYDHLGWLDSNERERIKTYFTDFKINDF